MDWAGNGVCVHACLINKLDNCRLRRHNNPSSVFNCVRRGAKGGPFFVRSRMALAPLLHRLTLHCRFCSGVMTDLQPASAVVMDADEMRRAWTRVAHEILEHSKGAGDLVIVGILRKGAPLAQRLAAAIERIEGTPVPCGVLDISLYRDDFRTYQPRVGTTQIPFDIEGRTLVMVDDVLSTGRTVRAALAALVDLGRPAATQLAVLVDRGHRELPIRPDYVGKNLPTARAEFVQVFLHELDDEDKVVITKSGDAP